MTVVTVGMVGNTLQPSLGANPYRLAATLHPTAPGWVRPNQGPTHFRLAASSSVAHFRLVNFGPIDRVISEFLAYPSTSLILDIVRLIDRLF